MARAEFFLQNAGWKLASLLLAVAIWIFVRSTFVDPGRTRALGTEPSESRSFTLPITVMTTATDSRGFFVRPSVVEVTVRGPKPAIDQLQDSDLQVFVSLVDVQEAQELRKKILVRTPPGIALLGVNPEQVLVDRANPEP